MKTKMIAGKIARIKLKAIAEALVEIAFSKIDSVIPLVADRNRVINYIASRNWFIDWNINIEMDSVLLKKELRTPY